MSTYKPIFSYIFFLVPFLIIHVIFLMLTPQELRNYSLWTYTIIGGFAVYAVLLTVFFLLEKRELKNGKSRIMQKITKNDGQ